MRRLLKSSLATLFAVVLSGCASMTTVKVYDGPEQDQSRLAILQLDPHVMVSRVDNISNHPGGGTRVVAHSAGKRRESIAVLPGRHELSARFFVLCLQSDEITIPFTAEAGGRYRLKSVVDAELKKWRPSIVPYLGEPVEDNVPWLKALCPPALNITIRLGR